MPLIRIEIGYDRPQVDLAVWNCREFRPTRSSSVVRRVQDMLQPGRQSGWQLG